jgi:transposase
MTNKPQDQRAAGAGRSSTPGGEPPKAEQIRVEPLAPGQRWSVARKREVVLRLLRGESLETLSRELGVEPYRLAEWREKALLGLEGALKAREANATQAALDAAMQRIGELTMENELLWQRVRKPGPLAKRRS